MSPRGSSDVGSGGVMVRIGLTKRPISTIALPYSSYAFASTRECRAISQRVLRVIVDTPEIVAVRHRRERAVEWQNLESVARQIQLADDFGAQQRDDVRRDGEFEAGKDLFGDGGPAEHVTALEDEHLAARAGEIRGVDEPVMSAADDDDVVVHSSLKAGSRKPEAGS